MEQSESVPDFATIKNLSIALLHHQLSPSVQLSVISVLFSTMAYNSTVHQEFY